MNPDYTFATPWALLLLLLIPITAFLQGRFGGSPAVTYSSTKTFREIGRRTRSHAGFFSRFLFHISLVGLILALARPQKGNDRTEVSASGIDIILALDVSRSMLAEDFTVGNQRTNRLVASKEVSSRFIQGRPADRIGIIAFAGQPYLVSPLTLDHDWLLQNVERVRIGMVEDGTAIGSAIASATRRLQDRDSKSKIVVLLTDGENNSGKIAPLTAAEAAASLGIKVYTIGVGSRGQAPFPVQDPFGRTFYQMMDTEFDEETLKQIAEKTGAQYFRATDTQSLEEIFAEIDKLEKSEVKVTRFRNFTDLYAWFLIPGMMLLFLKTTLDQTLWRRTP